MGEAFITRRGGSGGLKGIATDITSQMTLSSDETLYTFPVNTSKTYVIRQEFKDRASSSYYCTGLVVSGGVQVVSFEGDYYHFVAYTDGCISVDASAYHMTTLYELS